MLVDKDSASMKIELATSASSVCMVEFIGFYSWIPVVFPGSPPRLRVNFLVVCSSSLIVKEMIPMFPFVLRGVQLLILTRSR